MEFNYFPFRDLFGGLFLYFAMFKGLTYNFRDFLPYQEQIFQLAFNITPEIGKYYYSPFRDDKTPKCRFEYSGEYLYFIDNARYNGKLRFNCFQAVQIMHHLSTLQGALNFIANNINTTIEPIHQKQVRNNFKKNDIIIRCTHVPFTENNYFSQFGLTPKQLNADPEVYNVENYWCTTSKDSNLMYNRFGKGEIAYHFRDTGETKLYFPSKNIIRWYSNCGIKNIFNWCYINEFFKDFIIITKSKKDAMILWLIYGFPAIGVQNEGCHIPDDKLKVIKTFNQQFLLFDNDAPGQEAAKEISNRYQFENIKFADHLPKDVGEVQLLNNDEIKNLINYAIST